MLCLVPLLWVCLTEPEARLSCVPGSTGLHRPHWGYRHEQAHLALTQALRIRSCLYSKHYYSLCHFSSPPCSHLKEIPLPLEASILRTLTFCYAELLRFLSAQHEFLSHVLGGFLQITSPDMLCFSSVCCDCLLQFGMAPIIPQHICHLSARHLETLGLASNRRPSVRVENT